MPTLSTFFSNLIDFAQAAKLLFFCLQELHTSSITKIEITKGTISDSFRNFDSSYTPARLFIFFLDLGIIFEIYVQINIKFRQ